jgi:phospholipase C
MVRPLIFLLILFILLPDFTRAEEGEATALAVPATDSLKVLSWNIYMLPPLVMFTGKRKRADAIGDTLSKSGYDVLVLQEAFHHGARRRLTRKLKDVYPYRVGPVHRKLFSPKTSSGIWILSRHPMKKVAATKYRNKSGLDNKMARKGAAMVRVVKNHQPFHIVGTHLNAGGSLDLRASQVRQIREDLIDKHHQPDVPLIIAGDFNIERTEKAGLDSMLCILEVSDYTLHGPFQYTVDGSMNDLRPTEAKGFIDYVFVNPGAMKPLKLIRQIPLLEKRWSKKNKSLSDHNPVELILHYPR